MDGSAYQIIGRLLASNRAEDVHQGLELVRKEIARMGTDEVRPLFEMVSTLFYIDPLDRPDLVQVLDEAISLVAGFGKWVIPVLVQNLESGDLKAEIASAHALGRIGVDAIAPLLSEYRTTADPAARIFILYALSKIKSPKISEAIATALEAAGSTDSELRDTATRVLGKFAESIPPSELPEETRVRILSVLQSNLVDKNVAIRSKAVRSLGKLAKHGHLKKEDRERLSTILSRILGKDEHFEWDRAYVVRKEAEEVLGYL